MKVVSVLSMLPVATVLLLTAAGCWHRSAPPTAPQPVSVASPAVFVGSAECVQCHQAECDTQGGSRHAHTLNLMTPARLGKLAPPNGSIPRTGLFLRQDDDPAQGKKFVVGFRDTPDKVVPLDYALGSGKTGMTYVAVIPGEKLAELRMSYFPHLHSWYVTPGQETLEPDSLGKVHPPADARKCFLCHAVTLPDETVVPQPQFYGVGCEACHGPAGAHVAAMRAGNNRESHLDNLASWPATRLNELCGKCHGTERDVQEKQLPPDVTNRLQAYGLMRSACFKQSRDTLSCITCHDPHTDVSTNTKTYEAACLRCHASEASAQRPAPLRTVTIKPCPVNPTGKCIGCHMPKRKAIANTELPTFMADHFIRVFPRSP